MKKIPEKLKEQAMLWIKNNENDWHSAHVEFIETKNFSLVGFLCQQIIERYLKVCLMLFKGDYPKIHNLMELLKLVGKYDKNILDYNEECLFVDDFYIETRYPIACQLVRKQDAKQALEYTESVVEFIKKLIALKLK